MAIVGKQGGLGKQIRSLRIKAERNTVAWMGDKAWERIKVEERKHSREILRGWWH